MIPASFVSYTLTQPVARVAEIADAKEKAAKDRAVRVLTDERMSPLEDLQKCEEHFPAVIREHIARASMKLPIPVVADRFGISTCYVGEVRREFKEKQEEKSEF